MVQVHNALVILFICAPMIVEADGSEDTLPQPKVSRWCKKIGICDSVSNYPVMLAKKLIKELKDKNTVFDADDEYDISEEDKQRFVFRISSNTGNDIEKQVRSKKTKILSRFYGDKDYIEEEDNEIKLCESTVQNKYPKIAENRNNTWQFILNDDDDPVQKYRFAICKTSGSKCSEKLIPELNYESACIQSFTFKEMYYIKKNKQIGKDYFKVPTCCSCKLFHTN
ncbi:uncharacterized protein LOC125065251 [Vanessa atalanta]|uniref:uncharacterized protein LOC125065251 n=1 Tax=Vanessa atalanta TaxID=42275 RepID=UPI001FCD50C0|nr:uncharacterized protein LOC125065251 [Vanessa atalanta]